MTRKDAEKFVLHSGTARYRANHMLAWRPGRIRPGQEFEHDYPVIANPESYELLEVLVEPKLAGGKKAKAEPKPAPEAEEAAVAAEAVAGAPAEPAEEKPKPKRRRRRASSTDA